MTTNRVTDEISPRGSETGRSRNRNFVHGRGELPALTDRQQAWCRFGYGCAALVLIWGGVLPCLGELPLLRAHVERLEDAQINTGAMFYTELRESEREWNWLRDQ